MMPALGAPNTRPQLRHTTAVRALPENVPEGQNAAPGEPVRPSQAVDWARFAATVQSNIRKNEH
jgi:hypothetical protein